jgi:hypothetical protein
LGAFYGGLLVLLPAYRGIINGKLPIEISARGTKFAEEVDRTILEAQEAVNELEKTTEGLKIQMGRARLNIDQIASEADIALRD